ncbi:glycosyltransferase family 2 protein [Thermasporomyces composti]|jgi:glycosyltransferase involved in cell wall biosynthesis|uniref:Glycosyltransferase involved in cell wall biosynthesis n=1 Tax=Thermasporomyces composti TaxID=696763 RepID=A0A3D9V0Z3_THECX|nr:glycosyltransferase family 2 protein [Thermasporomyces composti]REF35076.1 glycosyltransferase involved in cell wall biosynthesis [Thermasporomyces composti]
MIKVSVVVPVYNPGPYLEPCIESLLNQSLSPHEYEMVFVDDGSTDDAPARLDKLAAEHDNVLVLHQENSGWPGKPRNVGIDHARGEYIQFVDQDDQLGAEALERMYALAVRNGSDIVLGKVGGTMTGPNSVFRETVERCTIEDAPLIDSLSPHKMFRRAFLLEHDLRFPEGRRRLEDQLFMVQAYLKARTVSILGDYCCYYWNRRDDGGNSSGTASTMEGYYDNLREVLDAVEAGTEPGELRDRLMRRFFRVEMMTRLREPRLLRYSEGYRRRGYEVVRKLAIERFSTPTASFSRGPVVAGLSPIMRLRARLLDDDRLDGLMELARRCENVRGFATLDDLRWEDNELRVDIRTGLVHADGSPVVVVERDGRYELDPILVAGLPGIESWDVGDPREHVKAEVRVYHRDARMWWFAPATMRPTLVPVGAGKEARYQVVVTGTASLDPRRLAGGGPAEPGRYEVWVSVQTLGLGRPVRLIVEGGERWERALVPAVVGDPARVVVPFRAMPTGQLILEIDERHQALPSEIAARGVGPLQAYGTRLHLAVPVLAGPGAGAREVEVVIGRAGSARTLPGRLQPSQEAVLSFNDVTTLPPGRHPLALRTDVAGRSPAIPIGTAIVQGGRIVDVRGISYRAIPRRVVSRVAASPWLHRQVYRALAAMPETASERARELVRKAARWSRG